MEPIYIYTDGACSGNPGPGGWAALLSYKGREKIITGGERETTNNRMELTAAIKALSAIIPKNKDKHRLCITTDSLYLKEGVEQWLSRWRRNRWKTSNKKPVKNQDLWVELDNLIKNFDIEWRWVRGHSGHPQNERVDRLAQQSIPSDEIN